MEGASCDINDRGALEFHEGDGNSWEKGIISGTASQLSS
jgi:hypothetical protein